MTDDTTTPADQELSNPGTKQAPEDIPVTQLVADEARKFFMKNKSYCGIDLPQYFNFAPLLGEVLSKLQQKPLASISKDVRSVDSVNHTILTNKGRGHDWRPLQLIHPAIYVQLVTEITEEQNWNVICKAFENFKSNEMVECSSVPLSTSDEQHSKVAQINSWWQRFEQRSIELALEYEYVATSDIVDCYSSIYTHSIAWAIHDKESAKLEKRNRTLIGNVIDARLQDMHAGQTNGIPQGSALSDFVAEMVLGYVDQRVIQMLAQNEMQTLKILRFRDDYRIFAHSSEIAAFGLRCLSEATREVGLKMNSVKTDVSNDVITSSIKTEKLNWLLRRPRSVNPLNALLDIRQHSLAFPDAGSVRTALSRYHRRIRKRKKPYVNTRVLASVVLDIALRNPSTYPHAASVLSVFIDLLDGQSRDVLATGALRKFSASANSGLMQIWLQRIILKAGGDHEFDELLCRKVNEPELPLWHSEWITWGELKSLIDTEDVVDRKALSDMEVRIGTDEVDLFGEFDY